MHQIISQMVLSLLNLNFDVSQNDLNKSDFNHQYTIAYFFRKIIFAKTRYKIYNAKLLAIIKTFKI